MTDRKRHLAALTFQEPDKIPFQPGGGRKSTLERWHRDGLPSSVGGGGVTMHLRKELGIEPAPICDRDTAFSPHERMKPLFEEKVLERKGDSQIVQDWKGNICEIGAEYGPEYLRNAIDFVTRRWIKCPVESRDDWREMKKRYDAEDTDRVRSLTADEKEQLKNRDFFWQIHFSGPYWQLREWCGFEGLSMLFYDDPALVEEMIDFWRQYVGRLIERTLAVATPDMVHISEDMAYKGFSMLSPEMVRRFLLPCWQYWGELIHNAAVPLYGCDSDGYVGELIPIWIEAGINACDPMEVAAGNDINEFRRRFGRHMAYRGGVDKREMAKGGDRITAEMERIKPVIDDGGFIPSCDHGVPADVSWPHFKEYAYLLAQMTGWLR